MEEPRRLGGRYELGSVLGRGGMAEVYLAHDTRLGRTVAVKTLRADLARDPSFQARFRREAQSAASLNHPAIVAVYDTGEDYVDGVSIPYIVMEYVDGSTLRELLHSGRKLLPERSLEMAVGILQALEYSHRNGIVHRDIKPANVMLTRTGQVKVMDFGIARAMGDSGMTMTQTAAVIGTAQYLSPEQAKGETVDARSDLYSTGCLLYELLTVRPPFVGDSPVAVAYQHVREEPQPPSVYDPEVTPEMDAIVLKALTKDPDYRYQSADEMRADVEACLDGQPVAATAALGAVGYGYGNSSYSDAPTTALPRNQDAGHTSVLPPTPAGPDDGYGYEDRRDRRRSNQRKSRASTILLVLAAMLVLVGAVFIGKSIFSGGANDQISVPDLKGQTLSQAQTSAQNVGLTAQKGGDTFCDEPKNTVCSQTPAANSTASKGQTITLTMSKGPAPVSVPSVVGQPQDSATQALESAGFQVSVKQDDGTSGQPAGQVLKQDPAGNAQAQKGSTVTITVAASPQQVTVPNVVGQQFSQAQSQLQNMGFKVVESDAQASQPAGQVIAQSPSANAQAAQGTTVTLTVSKGQSQGTLPDETGKTLAQAKQDLASLGLNLQISGPSDPNAVVVSTNPPAGTQVTQGQAVTIQTMDNPNGGNGNGGFIGGMGG
ncbi:Stk1 family PASTA domain-containing Ser/Thr kinase [Streptomyces sp. RB6PN25]|uniref:non-specific serine/threonine protein kinase n=1 Tax=Streptomyces humicola TaxID=2953240 RepID=A0ABT1PZZ0_9ACTN|nr:Stk1 family PASTA domain-containing Ser/Thr kinase [Streptomyces humicola]MCQ4083232.1 Stk1 family PASTA domain-containing Ser/Thr kinase [Streptomyces humicola]